MSSSDCFCDLHHCQGFKVPPQFMEDSFVERVKGTGPFTVVLVALDCKAAKEKVTVAPCDSKVRIPEPFSVTLES